MKRPRWAIASLVGILMIGGTTAYAQDQGAQGGQGQGTRQRGQRGQQGGQGGQGGTDRRNFDPAQMRERFYARYKEQLGSNDEEWKVLQPKLEKVLNAQRQSRSSGGGGDRGRGGPGGGDRQQASTTQREQSAVSKASSELRAVLEDKSASAEQINAKVVALRDAKNAAKAELAAAQKEFRELLTARQEAVMIQSGVLE